LCCNFVFIHDVYFHNHVFTPVRILTHHIYLCMHFLCSMPVFIIVDVLVCICVCTTFHNDAYARKLILLFLFDACAHYCTCTYMCIHYSHLWTTNDIAYTLSTLFILFNDSAYCCLSIFMMTTNTYTKQNKIPGWVKTSPHLYYNHYEAYACTLFILFDARAHYCMYTYKIFIHT